MAARKLGWVWRLSILEDYGPQNFQFESLKETPLYYREFCFIFANIYFFLLLLLLRYISKYFVLSAWSRPFLFSSFLVFLNHLDIGYLISFQVSLSCATFYQFKTIARFFLSPKVSAPVLGISGNSSHLVTIQAAYSSKDSLYHCFLIYPLVRFVVFKCYPIDLPFYWSLVYLLFVQNFLS